MKLIVAREPPRLDATLGALTVADLTLQTLERLWIPDPDGICGRPEVSCLPIGDYELVRHDTPKHPRTFALFAPALHVWHQPCDIPPGCVGRSECLIHSANFASQLEGCMAVGRGRAFVNGHSMITDSRAALSLLLQRVPWIDGHTLSIVESTCPAQ